MTLGRSLNFHLQSYLQHTSIPAMGSPYYRDMDEPISPAGGGHHRSRSATRAPTHSMEYPREQLRKYYYLDEILHFVLFAKTARKRFLN